MSGVIALLTDFGTIDTYVGVMKGVMLDIAPDVRLVDLTHAVQPQNIRQAAFALLNAYRYFPTGTIFLVVVDPGVGSVRRPIAVQSGGFTFVAPDNGVLSYVLRELDSPRQQAVELTSPLRRLSGTSSTFHGRDIFAPAAAHLAAGVPLDQFGAVVDQPVFLPLPSLIVKSRHIVGEVLHIDHFGTAVTSIGILRWESPDHLSMRERFRPKATQKIDAHSTVVSVGDQCLSPVHKTYAEVAAGEALALVGSSGYLELSVNQGSFAERAGVQIGNFVTVAIG